MEQYSDTSTSKGAYGGIQGQSLEFWIRELGKHPTVNKVMEYRNMSMFLWYKRL